MAKAKVDHALFFLDDRQSLVIRLYYGFDDEEPMTLQAIGQYLGGLSRERVRQIKKQAMDTLHHVLCE